MEVKIHLPASNKSPSARSIPTGKFVPTLPTRVTDAALSSVRAALPPFRKAAVFWAIGNIAGLSFPMFPTLAFHRLAAVPRPTFPSAGAVLGADVKAAKRIPRFESVLYFTSLWQGEVDPGA